MLKLNNYIGMKVPVFVEKIKENHGYFNVLTEKYGYYHHIKGKDKEKIDKECVTGLCILDNATVYIETSKTCLK